MYSYIYIYIYISEIFPMTTANSKCEKSSQRSTWKAVGSILSGRCPYVARSPALPQAKQPSQSMGIRGGASTIPTAINPDLNAAVSLSTGLGTWQGMPQTWTRRAAGNVRTLNHFERTCMWQQLCAQHATDSDLHAFMPASMLRHNSIRLWFVLFHI